MVIEIVAELQKRRGGKKEKKKKGGFQVFVDPGFHRGNVILDCLQAGECQGIQRLLENENKQNVCAASGGGK